MEMEHLIEAVRKYPCLWNSTAIEYRDQELKDAAWAEVMKESNLSSVKEVKLKWKKLRDSYRDALKRQSDMLAKDGGAARASAAGKKNYPWKYMGLMQFLQPHMNNRKKLPEPQHAPPENGISAGVVGVAGVAGVASAAALNGEPHSSDESDSEASSSPKRKSCERLTVIDRKLDYLCKAHTQTKRRLTEAQHAAAERRRPSELPPLAAAPDPLDIFFNSMCQSTKRFPFPTQIKIKKVLFGAVIEAEEALLAEQQSYASLWAAGGAPGSSSSSDNDEKPS